MALTDTAIRNAKPRETPFKLFDGGGLHVLVTPSGSKLFRMKYRIDGREKLLSFGPYPEVTLREARDRRDDARRQMRDGLDPAEEKKRAIREAQRARAVTFGVVAEDYLDKLEREGRAAATLKKNRWLVDLCSPALSDRPIAEIESPDVLSVLQEVEAKGTHETARRLRSTVGAIFRFAIATGRARTDPTEALKGALVKGRVQSRAAILDRRELGLLLKKIDESSGQPATRCALQLLALLAPRPGELRQARWAEFDLDEAVWRVPAERMKMRRPHRVPLPVRAVSLLRELHTVTGSSDFAFPSSRSWAKPISDGTLNAALRRLGYGSDQITAHGFWAIFATFANESGLWHVDAVERALAHVEGNDVRRAYVRGEHWEERVRMSAWWAELLEEFKTASSA